MVDIQRYVNLVKRQGTYFTELDVFKAIQEAIDQRDREWLEIRIKDLATFKALCELEESTRNTKLSWGRLANQVETAIRNVNQFLCWIEIKESP